jgi:hypothetical protein
MISLEEKLRLYASGRQLRIGKKLGEGHQGSVFVAEHGIFPTRYAVKFHVREEAYMRERDVYVRLTELGIHAVEGFNVPEFLGVDDELFAIEMTIVQPPFLLDFAGAYLDSPPHFPATVWDEWLQQKAEEFGDRWPTVEDVLAILHARGIHLIDIHARNIMFKDEG